MLFLKLGALTIVHLVSFVAAYGALMPAMPAPAGPEPVPAMAGLLLVAGANATVVAWMVRRSDAPRWRLTLALFLALWGIQTVLAQIETAVFPGISERVPEGFVARAMLAGMVQSALFVPVAVWLLARRHRSADGSARPLPLAGWLWRASAAAAVFVALYFTCGYFIAWRQPALAAYYGGVDPGSFVAQLGTVVAETPWLVPLQGARGAVWALLLALVVRRLRCSRGEAAAAAGALSGITTLGLLLPNPFMPFDVRMIHLLETVTANVLFGAFAGWWFSGSPGASPARTLVAGRL